MDSNSIDHDLACIICEHSCNSEAERPLILPCSHSICQDCFQIAEATEDSLCPVCRTSWSDTQLADLPSCYQLIPAGGLADQIEEDKTTAAYVSFPYGACGEHDEEDVLWCETCRIPTCIKCWSLKHGSCDLLFMTEKWDALKDEYSKRIASIQTAQESKFPIYLAGNKKNIKIVKDMKEKLNLLEEELQEHQKKLEAWQVKVQNTVSSEEISRVTSRQNVKEVSTKISKAEHLEQQLALRPASLLLQIATSYQGSPDDADAFLNNLQNALEGYQTENLSCQQLDAKQCDADAPPATLAEGAVWEICDAKSAAAVNDMILTTSTRPCKLKVSWTADPKLVFNSLLSSNQQMEVLFMLDCFNMASQEAKALTTSFIDTMGWCRVVQFWGHLEPSALRKLPKTVQNLGLVLKDQEDMDAVNALCGLIFSTQYHQTARQRLLWPHLNEINLSLAKTFLPNHWKLNWAWKLYKNLSSYSSVTLSALHPICIRLRLHLPQLLPQDTGWMKAVLGAMKLNIIDTVPLLLPGASIDADPLLGVLRDIGQRWEVHLPASLPQLVPRKEVTERYKKYGHSVTWDLK